MNWETTKVKESLISYDMFYISDGFGNYLHHDGQTTLDKTHNKEGVFTGYYRSIEAAQKVLDKYKPTTKVLTVKDLKPGDRFLFKNLKTIDEKMVKILYDWNFLPINENINPSCVYVLENQPFKLRWLADKFADEEVVIVP